MAGTGPIWKVQNDDVNAGKCEWQPACLPARSMCPSVLVSRAASSHCHLHMCPMACLSRDEQHGIASPVPRANSDPIAVYCVLSQRGMDRGTEGARGHDHAKKRPNLFCSAEIALLRWQKCRSTDGVSVLAQHKINRYGCHCHTVSVAISEPRKGMSHPNQSQSAFQLHGIGHRIPFLFVSEPVADFHYSYRPVVSVSTSIRRQQKAQQIRQLKLLLLLLFSALPHFGRGNARAGRRPKCRRQLARWQYRFLFTFVPEAPLVPHLDGRITNVNARWAPILSLSVL